MLSKLFWEIMQPFTAVTAATLINTLFYTVVEFTGCSSTHTSYFSYFNVLGLNLPQKSKKHVIYNTVITAVELLVV